LRFEYWQQGFYCFQFYHYAIINDQIEPVAGIESYSSVNHRQLNLAPDVMTHLL
jgi:hypothetical protein